MTLSHGSDDSKSAIVGTCELKRPRMMMVARETMVVGLNAKLCKSGQ